jgi:uncharacterized protein (DUF2336 family)
MLETMAAIASDPSSEARGKLLVAMGEMVFDRRQPTASEVSALCSVAKLLLKMADDGARSEFAGKIATSRLVPRDMVFLLLQDKVIVAGPLLQKSPVLSDDDLLAFAESLTDDRLQFVAQRDKLGKALVEILVSRGNETVQLAISENTSAELSAKSLQVLIGKAETSEPLCRSLVRRTEVSKSDAERLVHLITKMLKARMKAQAKSPIEPAAMPVIEVPEAPRPAKPAQKASVGDLIARIRAGQMGADEALTQLADDDRFNDLTALISNLSRMDDISVMRLLVRADANGIGMILKALELSDRTFAAIVALRKRRLKISEVQARYDREDFAKLSVADSKATLAQLTGGHDDKKSPANAAINPAGVL